MKIGFSSLACPGWDLNTIIAKAGAMGFDGVELRGVLGTFDLPAAPSLADDPAYVKGVLAENKVELVCLSSSASLEHRHRKKLQEAQKSVVEYMRLANRLGCPYVKVFSGEVGRWGTSDAAATRIVQAARELIPAAVDHDVTLLIENSGDFTGSDQMWHVVDAVGHPRFKCCWNQCNAMTRLEGATLSIPRLGAKIGLVHVCDADYDESGVLKNYRPLGTGQINVARQIELLTGVVYDGYLVFEWPKAWLPSLADPEDTLPQVVSFLKERLQAKQNILSAYKGDKNAAKFSTKRPAATAVRSR